MNHSWAKKRATSRRAGSRRDVRGHVATCGVTSRRAGSRRDVTESKQAHVTTFGFTSRRGRKYPHVATW